MWQPPRGARIVPMSAAVSMYLLTAAKFGLEAAAKAVGGAY